MSRALDLAILFVASRTAGCSGVVHSSMGRYPLYPLNSVLMAKIALLCTFNYNRLTTLVN